MYAPLQRQNKAAIKTSTHLQTKLTVTAPGDAYEHEADRVAEEVMRIPDSQTASTPQLNSRNHHDETSAKVQMKSAEPVNADGVKAPPIVDEVLHSPGQPLDASVRAFMEPRFRYDFSKVKVHTDAKAAESARAVGARAYTVGPNVVFGTGEYRPLTETGHKLLGHELTHVVQQGSQQGLQSGAEVRQSSGLRVARTPKTAPFEFTPQDAAYLRNTMLRFYALLGPKARASLQRNTTVVIALVTEANEPTLVFTVAGNSINPQIRNAAEQLGLARWDPEGIETIAGAHHAEQLTVEAGEKLGFKVHGMVVSRTPCADCGPFIAEKKIPIEFVRDPAPRIGTGGGGIARPGTGVSGEGAAEEVLGGAAKTSSKAGRFVTRLAKVGKFAGPLLDAYLMLLSYRDVDIDSSAFSTLSAEKLQPFVDKEVSARSAEIAKVATGPGAFSGVYANVKCEMHYRYVPDPKGKSLGKLVLYDMRFLSLSISDQNLNKADWDKEAGRKANEGIQQATLSVLVDQPQYTPMFPEQPEPTDPLYFSGKSQRSPLGPQPITTDELVKWARTKHPRLFDDPTLAQDILSSNEFTGSQQAREKALNDLRRRLQEEKLFQ